MYTLLIYVYTWYWYVQYTLLFLLSPYFVVLVITCIYFSVFLLTTLRVCRLVFHFFWLTSFSVVLFYCLFSTYRSGSIHPSSYQLYSLDYSSYPGRVCVCYVYSFGIHLLHYNYCFQSSHFQNRHNYSRRYCYTILFQWWHFSYYDKPHHQDTNHHR